MRWVIAAVLIAIAFGGKALDIVYTPSLEATVVPVSPDDRKLVEGIKVDGILPADRAYYSAFYAALGEVLKHDGERDTPAIDTTEKFRRVHAGSLNFALERKRVGKYDGLGAQIDEAFRQAAVTEKAKDGLDVQAMTRALRDRLQAACAALAWKFAVHRDG